MVITKRMVGKYEIYYKAHQGQDIDHMVIENNHFKEIISDLHKKIKDKNKEIVELKVVVAYLNEQIIEKDKEITQIKEDLDSNRDKTKDSKRRMELAIKELNVNHLAFNSLRFDFNNAYKLD